MSSIFKPLMIQSLKTGGLYILIIALSVAISATTALKFSNDQIQQAIVLQAAEMLGADLVLSDNAPLAAKWQQTAKQQQLQQSQVTVFGSMARTNDQFVMVNVKAIDQNFPLRGQLDIRPQAKHLAAGQIWLSPRARDLLHVGIGDQIFIADGEFRVTGIIEHDPNQEVGFSAFSPTVMISQADIAKTHAVQVGSRIEYRLLLSGAAQNTQAFEQFFKTQQQTPVNAEHVTPSLKLQTAAQANSRLMKPIENLDTFLQLANILTILLCGIAIALTSQRYVQQNQNNIALIRCLGATRLQIIWAYLALLGVVAAISIVLGAVFGVVLGYGLLQLMLQLIPQLHLDFSLSAFLFGPLPIAIFTSVVVTIGFILPSIINLLNTPPIRVIRQSAQSKRSFVFIVLAGVISLAVFSMVLSENITLSLWILAAILGGSVILYAVIWVFLKFIKQLKVKFSGYVRTPAHTALQMTALALGLSLIAVLAVLRTDLLERWQQQLPEGTPNQFIYGLPPQDLSSFKQNIEQYGWKTTPLYPNVRGRLISKNHQAFSEQLIQQNNSLRRELNLTQASHLPKDNTVLQGTPQFTRTHQVSVEAKVAQELNIQVGDELGFQLPEGELTAKVVSLRSVTWENFSPNFFFIFSPKTLDENAGSYLGSFYVPPKDKNNLVHVIQQFPNTVFIDITLILNEVKQLVQVLAQIITLLAALVGVSGILVLIACLNLLMEERRREVALIRAFGVSRVKLKRMLSLEIGFIGLISGIVACVFAEIISAIASYKMNMNVQWHPEIWLILPLSMMLICGLIGRFRLSYLCDIPPLQSLRDINPS